MLTPWLHQLQHSLGIPPMHNWRDPCFSQGDNVGFVVIDYSLLTRLVQHLHYVTYLLVVFCWCMRSYADVRPCNVLSRWDQDGLLWYVCVI